MKRTFCLDGIRIGGLRRRRQRGGVSGFLICMDAQDGEISAERLSAISDATTQIPCARRQVSYNVAPQTAIVSLEHQMLDLNDLGQENHPGISAAKGAELAEACAVCLEDQGHHQDVELAVQGTFNRMYRLAWEPVTPQVQRTWDDDQEATEDGAACIAAFLADREIGQTVILRTRKSTAQQPTGFDYWLGDDNIAEMSAAERMVTESLANLLADDNLVARTRLEVSGIRNGNNATIVQRVQRKLRQMNRSDALGLPAYAIVIEFGRPVAEVRQK